MSLFLGATVKSNGAWLQFTWIALKSSGNLYFIAANILIVSEEK
jgi:hypothetical protein